MPGQDQLTPEDIKWLGLVREREMFDRRTRPLPMGVQTRLRTLGLIESRKGKPVLTAAGQKALREAKR